MKVAKASAQRLLGTAFSRAVKLATAPLALPFRPDELCRVPTRDGSSIALGRYYARGARRFEEPVVLCHGLGANRYNLDFDERYSLARYLANRGYETWVLELRGRGLAGPPQDSTFDAQATFDVEAALRTVRSSGAREVTWVGHSKGGLVLYAHLSQNPEAPVRAAVTIGTPLTFAVQKGVRGFIDRIEPTLSWGVIPTGTLVPGLAPFGVPPGPFGRYLMEAENMDVEVIKKVMANVPADIPGGVGRQFAQWIRSGKFDSTDGSVDYRKDLSQVQVPHLLIAGAQDRLAPVEAVALARAHLGGPSELAVLGKATGYRCDYGHGDLVLGRDAPDEVFPLIERFLARHSSAVRLAA